MLKIKWIGQGGYLLGDGVSEICIDPYLSDAVERHSGKKRLVKAPFLPEELNADAVICTHNHIDHVDTDAIPRMADLHFYAPADCEETVRMCGVKNYTPFDEGTVVRVGDFELEAVYADHTTATAIGVIVRHSGKSLYFTGDTFYNERLVHKGVDFLIVCINGKLGNMNVEEAITLANKISPRVAIPSHYGMFAENTENPEKFTQVLANGFEMKYNFEYSVEDILCLI